MATTAGDTAGSAASLRPVASGGVASGGVAKQVLLVSSSGGVLLDLLALQPWWGRHEIEWVAVAAADTSDALRSYSVTWSDELSARRPLVLARALLEALRRLALNRPDVVVSGGSGIAVPYFVAARILSVPSVWVETFNVLGRPGLASRVCGSLATTVVVQHPELLERHRRAVYVGELL